MTPAQRYIARRALGLPNGRKVSYRNRFTVSSFPGGAYQQWEEMVDAGFAERVPKPDLVNGLHRFRLTLKGAEAALDPGESLCKEDFPT